MTFSDDGGKSWKISMPIQTGGNECQVIERADGSLLVNTRMQGEFQGFRGIATSTDGGATWSALCKDTTPVSEVSGQFAPLLIGRCSGRRLLFSNPHPPESTNDKPSGARVNLTVRSSIDDGRTLTVARLLNEGPSAYSSLARLPDGTILCLYEGGEKRASESLRLARFNLEWLTDGKDGLPSKTPQ